MTIFLEDPLDQLDKDVILYTPCSRDGASRLSPCPAAKDTWKGFFLLFIQIKMTCCCSHLTLELSDIFCSADSLSEIFKIYVHPTINLYGGGVKESPKKIYILITISEI